MGESDVEFKEKVFESINSARREYEEEMYYDALRGEVMIKELVEAVRKVEMETFKKHGVCEKVPIEECWEDTGKGPVEVKWVDANKGDREKPEYCCRLVREGDQKGQAVRPVCGAAAAGGETDVFLVVGHCARRVLGLG